MTIEIRPATAADIELFYDETPKATLKAWVAVDGDTPLAIGGLFFHRNGAIGLFSVITAEMQTHKKDILRGARFLAEIARRAGAVAIADEKYPNSRRLLTRLGMVSLGQTQHGELFGWTN